MADGKAVAHRNIPRAEAGPAEAGLADHAVFQQRPLHSVFRQLQGDRKAGGIDGEGKGSASDAAPLQDRRRRRQIIVHASGAARDHALVDIESAVPDLIRQPDLPTQLHLCPLLHSPEVIPGLSHQLPQGDRLGGMEGQRGHGLQLVQLQTDQAVVIRPFPGSQAPVFLRTPVDGIVLLHLSIRLPDGAEGGGLGGHDVDADAEIHGQRPDPRSGKLQDLVFHKAVGVHRAAKGDGRIMRPDPVAGLAGHPDQNGFRPGQVIGVAQQLLDQLRSPLPESHGPQGAVAGMAVRAQDHLPAARQLLPGILVDHRHIWGHKNPPEAFRRRETEGMVVRIDGSSDGAKAVMAVGHGIGHGEGPQAAGHGGLDDAHIGDIMTDEAVEAQMEKGVPPIPVMAAQDCPAHGPLPGGGSGFLPRRSRSGTGCRIDNALFFQFDHRRYAPFRIKY